MKVIELTKGQVAIVDDEDFEWLAQYRWHCMKVGYAARRAFLPESVKSTILTMHRAIMNPPKGMQVDHINENKLDNRRCNLRLATKAQNMRNRGAQKNSTTGVKGVSFIQRKGRKDKYSAIIETDGKKKFLGNFNTLEEAKQAYQVAAIEMHGEFAHRN